MRKFTLIGTLVVASLLSACSSKVDTNTYYWGSYSDAVYDYYDKGDLVKQEELLQATIIGAKEKNKPVAPGVYGHLGLIKLKQGQYGEAQAAFQQEQALYPESRAFIQFLQKQKGK